MTGEAEHAPERPEHDPAHTVEMPAPTAWPMVLALAVTLLAMGPITNWAFSIVGGLLVAVAVASWMRQLLPGRGGHIHEEFVPPAERVQPVQGQPGRVEPLRPGVPGHRLTLPEKMHPYSAGVRGGIAGGMAMTVPALLYGLLSGHGLWFPINLLAGTVLELPRLENGLPDVAALEQFNAGWLVLATLIHAVTSVSLGLIYGVLLPMLPVPGRATLFFAILRGGIVAPLLWTGAIYSFMGVINPALKDLVSWPWFIASQFVYGLITGLVVTFSEMVYTTPVREGSQPPSHTPGPGGDEGQS